MRQAKPKRPCTLAGCSGSSWARGLCMKHYSRLVRGQNLTAASRFDRRPAIVREDVALIPLGIGAKHGYAIVDVEFKHLDKYNWTKGGDGYPATTLPGHITLKLHHAVFGNPPSGLVTDHIDRNKLNNRRSNLRFVQQTLNCINKRMQSNNTSGITGVTWVASRNKWMAQMHLNGKHIFLGHFMTKEEAAIARANAERDNVVFKEALQ